MKRIPWNKGKKGLQTAWNKGKKFSEESRKKMSDAKKGKPGKKGENSHFWKGGSKKCKDCGKTIKYESTRCRKCFGKNPIYREKLKKAKVGYVFSEEHRKNLSKSQIGKKGICGENHYNWKGGISNNPYPSEFNRSLKLKIRKRYNFKCCLCGKTEREELEELNRVLCVNHIDFNKNNCSDSNLNVLCVRCNIKINREREYWTNYFQTIL